jgi:hypothetical protein
MLFEMGDLGVYLFDHLDQGIGETGPRSKPASLHCVRRASSSVLRDAGTRIEMVPVGSGFCLRIFIVVAPLSNVGFVYNLQTFVKVARGYCRSW